MPQINQQILSTKSPLRTGNYVKTKKHFFNSSKMFDAQITDIFDYLWPTITALKNLRWQVNGYYHLSGAKENVKLTAKFVEDDDITNRPNLYRICIDEKWEDQEFNVTKSLLVNLIACYEEWCEMILTELNMPQNQIGRKSKELQFPSSCRATIAQICTPQSAVLPVAFHSAYAKVNNDSDLAHLENYLWVYRYFKECRNALLHSTGTIDAKVAQAYSQIQAFSPNDVDVQEFPQISGGALGDPLHVSLRGVVGFAQILRKIVSIIDIELINSVRAESCFANNIRHNMNCRHYGRANIGYEVKEARKIVTKHYYQSPAPDINLYRLLQSKGIVGR